MKRGDNIEFNSNNNILKTTYTGVVLNAELSFDLAQSLTETDLATYNNDIVQSRGQGETDVTRLTFFQLRQDNGDVIVLSLAWIDETSIDVISENTTQLIKLKNINRDKLLVIRAFLDGTNTDYEIIS